MLPEKVHKPQNRHHESQPLFHLKILRKACIFTQKFHCWLHINFKIKDRLRIDANDSVFMDLCHGLGLANINFSDRTVDKLSKFPLGTSHLH